MSKTAVIWTQKNCSYCESAKVLLSMRGWDIEEKRIGENATKADFIEANPDSTTVPQVFLNGKHIPNGYAGLRDLLG